ncbi:MAG: hypothetical protein M1496_07200, partial [Candidatus Thermoplasmatota archaeon]|nr:hypothetical protein [Candidatus Thermoplasmatota archaeon]
STPPARTIMIPFCIHKWIKIKPAIWITFIPAKMHNYEPAFTITDITITEINTMRCPAYHLDYYISGLINMAL